MASKMLCLIKHSWQYYKGASERVCKRCNAYQYWNHTNERWVQEYK
jgi:7-cyano-7-deazaguanine synthase in queuosine biosynthesis